MASDCIEVEGGMMSEVPLVNGTHNRQTAVMTKSVEPITTQQATSIRLSNGSNDANAPRQMATKAASNISRALSAALRQCKDGEQAMQQVQEYDVVNLDESDEEELEARPCYTPQQQQGDQANALAMALKQQSQVMTNMERAIDRQNQVMATLNTTLMKLVEVLAPVAKQLGPAITTEPTIATTLKSLSSTKHKSPLPAIAADNVHQEDEECQAKRVCLQQTP